MLIKIDEERYQEFPDELGILILADPSYGEDFPDFSVYEVNVLLHGTLGALYDTDKTFEQNVNDITDQYSMIAEPSSKNFEKAKLLIEEYNSKVPLEEIGVADIDDTY